VLSENKEAATIWRKVRISDFLGKEKLVQFDAGTRIVQSKFASSFIENKQIVRLTCGRLATDELGLESASLNEKRDTRKPSLRRISESPAEKAASKLEA